MAGTEVGGLSVVESGARVVDEGALGGLKIHCGDGMALSFTRQLSADAPETLGVWVGDGSFCLPIDCSVSGAGYIDWQCSLRFDLSTHGGSSRRRRRRGEDRPASGFHRTRSTEIPLFGTTQYRFSAHRNAAASLFDNRTSPPLQARRLVDDRTTEACRAFRSALARSTLWSCWSRIQMRVRR